MTFALPYGAFIAAAIALFYLFRARHSGPRLRWSLGDDAAQVSSVTTREPGPAPASEVTAAAASMPAAAAVVAATTESAPAPASAEDEAEADETEGKDGEQG